MYRDQLPRYPLTVILLLEQVWIHPQAFVEVLQLGGYTVFLWSTFLVQALPVQ